MMDQQVLDLIPYMSKTWNLLFEILKIHLIKLTMS